MNRQDIVDPVTELFVRVGLPLKKREICLFLIVGVIGCLGTMSIFKKSLVKKASIPQNLSTIKIMEQAASVTPALQYLDPYLDISGDLRASQLLAFTIKNFNENATYEIHFGDGSVYEGSDKNIEHAFTTDGNFDVSLIMHYKGNTDQVFETNLTIRRSEATLLSSL